MMLAVLLVACTSADSDPAPLRFGFPLPERALFASRIGVDHDGIVQDDSLLGRATCADYLGRGFPNCYDEHQGSDYAMDGGFDTMDAGSTDIVAAADGVVVEAVDGNYDRCYADFSTGQVSCGEHPKASNRVILEHEGGVRSLYWHMMTDTVAVAVGDEVACGEVLGKVGSSGESSLPHLHFELNDADGAVLDPYAVDVTAALWAEPAATDVLPGAGCAATP